MLFIFWLWKGEAKGEKGINNRGLKLDPSLLYWWYLTYVLIGTMFAMMKGFCLISYLPFDPTWKVLSIHGLKSLLPNALDCPKVKQKGRQPTLIWSYHSSCFPCLPAFCWQWNTELMRAWNKWNIPQQEIEVSHPLQLLGTKRISLCMHRTGNFWEIAQI